MHYVYVLQSLKKPDWLYKGSTSDLRKRIPQHNAGKNFSTAPYAPFRLIYYEAYLLKSDAEAREKYLKTSMGKRVLKKQLRYFLEPSKKDSKVLANIAIDSAPEKITNPKAVPKTYKARQYKQNL